MTKRTETVGAAVRISVMKRDRFRCTYCGVPGTDAELEVDHIISVATGGSNHMSNLTTACRGCNQKKGAGPAPIARAPSPPKPGPVIRNAGDPPFHEGLCCYVERIVYDYMTRTGRIYMGGEYSCTDMSGAIALFELLDQQVRLIETITSDGQPDTRYVRVSGKAWEAYVPRVISPTLASPSQAPARLDPRV